MRVGLIGLGSIGTRHLKNILENAERWGVGEVVCFDPCLFSGERGGERDKGDGAKWRRGGSPNKVVLCDRLPDFRVALFDAVVICTPPSRHYEYASMFPEAHILVEKPLSWWMPWEDLEEGRCRRLLVAGMNLRFHPGVEFIRMQIENKSIGDLRAVRAWYSFEGTANRPNSPDARLGALVSCIHDLDAALWATGERVEAFDKSHYGPDAWGVFWGNTQSGAAICLWADFLGKVRQRGMEIIGSECQARYTAYGRPTEAISCEHAEDDGRYVEYPNETGYDLNRMYVEELGEFFRMARGEGEPKDGWRLPDVGEILGLAEMLGVSRERGIP